MPASTVERFIGAELAELIGGLPGEAAFGVLMQPRLGDEEAELDLLVFGTWEGEAHGLIEAGTAPLCVVVSVRIEMNAEEPDSTGNYPPIDGAICLRLISTDETDFRAAGLIMPYDQALSMILASERGRLLIRSLGAGATLPDSGSMATFAGSVTAVYLTKGVREELATTAEHARGVVASRG